MGGGGKVRILWIGVLVFLGLAGLYLGATHYAGRLVEHAIRKKLGPGFSVAEVSLGLTEVTAKGVILKDVHRGKVLLKVEMAALFPSWTSLLSGKVMIRKILLQSPLIRIEKLADGRLISPLGTLGTPKETHPLRKAKGVSSTPRKAAAIKIGTVVVRDGTLFYIDSSLHPPVMISMKGFNLTLRNIEYPFRDEKVLKGLLELLPSVRRAA